MAGAFANAWSTSITTSTLTASGLRASVRTVQGAPQVPFRVRMGSEWAVVCDVVGGTSPQLVFSERGTEGSTAAQHNTGTLVTHVVTAADLNNIARQLAATPATPRTVANRLFLNSNYN